MRWRAKSNGPKFTVTVTKDRGNLLDWWLVSIKVNGAVLVQDAMLNEQDAVEHAQGIVRSMRKTKLVKR